MFQVPPTTTSVSPESHQRQLVDVSDPTYSGLFLSHVGFTLCRMQVAPFTILNWAYQLHYYVCFRTQRRRACFAEDRSAETLTRALAEICQRHDYHLLESQVYPDHVRSLLSLRPEQTLSAVIQTIKTNASREGNQQLGLAAPLWARGYLPAQRRARAALDRQTVSQSTI
jgi:REP element-mobilizing transposase RayT